MYQALIDDLRDRINPIYASMLGTESYERRLCVEALEDLTETLARERRWQGELLEAVRETLNENCYLADGDQCTLPVLKRAYEAATGEAWRVKERPAAQNAMTEDDIRRIVSEALISYDKSWS